MLHGVSRFSNQCAVLIISVVVVASLVAGSATASVTVGSDAPIESHGVNTTIESGVSGENETTPADAVYETDDGVVLVYAENEPLPDGTQTVNYGADMTTGLVNSVQEFENTGDDTMTGSATMEFTQGSVAGDGELTIPHNGEITDLNITADGEQSPETSYFTLSGTVDMGDTRSSGVIASSGTIESNPDALQIDAGYTVERPQQVASPSSGQVSSPQQVTQVTNTTVNTVGEDVVLTVSETNRPVTNATVWQNETMVEQQLSNQFQRTTEQYGGTGADVTVTSLSLTEATDQSPRHVDVSYRVEMTDARTGFGEEMATQLAEQPGVELSADGQQALAESLSEIEVNDFQLVQTQTQSATTIEISGRVTNYETGLIQYVNANVDGENVTEGDVETVEARLDARSDADLQQTVTWDVAYDTVSDGNDLTVDVEYGTENWEAYVTEVEERDSIDPPQQVAVSMTATGDQDAVDVTATVEMERDRLLTQAFDQTAAAMRGDGSTTDSEIAYLQALNDADLKVGKSDIEITRDTVRIRAAGQFDNPSELQSVPAASEHPVTHVKSNVTADRTVESYVYVNSSLEEVQESSVVSGGTEIYTVSEHDRSFPRMNTDSVAQYLGITVDDTNPTEAEGPGFGVGVALIAIVGAALFAARRYTDQ